MRSPALVVVALSMLAGCGFVAGVDFFGLERAGDGGDGGEPPAESSAGDAATGGDADAARLPRVYVMGGTDDASVLPARGMTFSAEIHADGTLGAWAPGPDLPVPRAYAAAASGADFVAMAGGISAPHGEEANFVVGSVDATGTLASLLTSSDAFAPARARAASAQHEGSVFVIGGTDSKGAVLTSVQHGTLTANSVAPFVASPSLPTPRARLAAAADDTTLYVVGGSDGTTSPTAILAAPFQGDDVSAFTVAGALPSGRVYTQATVYGGALLVVGGENPNALADVLHLPILPDGGLGPSSSTAPLPMGTARHQVVVHEGHLLVIGGTTADGASANVFVGELTPDGYVSGWRATTSLPAPLMFHTAVVIH